MTMVWMDSRRQAGWWRGLALLVLVAVAGCTHLAMDRDQWAPQEAWLPTAGEVDAEYLRFAPALVHDGERWNRPGTPRAWRDEQGRVRVRVDPEESALFVERRDFRGDSGVYANYLYRVHFERVPFRLLPFHLTAGRNGGLFVIVTVDAQERPVLVTTVHTCGCYRAFVPTTAMPSQAYPPQWPQARQRVFGETLPARLDWTGTAAGERLLVRLRAGTHRVMGLAVTDRPALAADHALTPMPLRPMAALDRLRLEDGTASMFHDEGPRRDLVRDSFKPFELALMSWWVFDPAVGVDRRLGEPGDGGRRFYTSLKPWARDASDLRDFPRFLQYWGWRL